MSHVHHVREGTGPSVVLIHGVGHHGQAWRPVMDLLTDHHDVLACDSPGFARSAPLPSGVGTTVGDYADAFEAFFAAEGLDRPHVAGNSMGGAIALELAKRSAVRSATAFSPAGFWTPGERRFAQLSLLPLARMPRPLQPAVLRLARTGPGRAALLAQLVKRPSSVPFDELIDTLSDAFAAPAFVSALKSFDHYEFTPAAEPNEVPVTVAWGDADRLLLFGRQSTRARSVLPRARHVTLDGGHLPFHDCPAAVARTIRETVASAP